MKTSDSIDKIAPALAQAQAKMGLVGKSGVNTHDAYAYAKLADYARISRPVLDEMGLALFTSVEDVIQLPDRVTKSGGSNYASVVTITMRLVHTSGQWVEITSKGEGQDRADKGIYKAITGARKYGEAGIFNLITTDDPEATDENGKATAGPDKKKSSAAAEPSDSNVNDLI